jgi:hypothetical protein
VTDINQLSTSDTLTAGDLLPIWRANNSDTRKTSLTTLQAYMQANLTFPSVAAGVSQFVVQYAAPVATGFTVTLVSTSNNQWLVMSPLGAYATGTITFPPVASCVDNQEILIYSTQIVTALTLSGNGATIAGSPGFISANGALRFKYNALGSVWYIIGLSATPRTVTGSTGLSVANGDGIAGNPTLTLDATLAGISAVTTAADQLVYSTGVDTFAATSFTAAGRALVDDATAAAQRTTLGVGTGDSPQFTAIELGNASDTTLSRSAAGVLAVEGVVVPTISSTDTLSNKTLSGVTIADATNIILNTTTGTKIGTATGQKLGFYNATPVIQQATTGTTTGFTAGSGTAAKDDSTFTGNVGSAAYTIGDIVRALKNLGLMAS